MDLTAIATLIDGGGTVALAVMLFVVWLRAERWLRQLAHGVAVLGERTRGLRVKRRPGRAVTVTIDPFEAEDEAEPKQE